MRDLTLPEIVALSHQCVTDYTAWCQQQTVPEMLAGPYYLFLERLVEAVQPSTVVEVGTASGASALCLARHLPHGAQVVTYDLDGGANRWTQTDDRIVARVCDSSQDDPRIPGGIELLFLDGCHDDEGVAADVRTWGPKMAPGGYVLFDDPLVYGGSLTALRAQWPTAPLVRLDHLHHTGFGCLRVPGSV